MVNIFIFINELIFFLFNVLLFEVFWFSFFSMLIVVCKFLLIMSLLFIGFEIFDSFLVSEMGFFVFDFI